MRVADLATPLCQCGLKHRRFGVRGVGQMLRIIRDDNAAIGEHFPDQIETAKRLDIRAPDVAAPLYAAFHGEK